MNWHEVPQLDTYLVHVYVQIDVCLVHIAAADKIKLRFSINYTTKTISFVIQGFSLLESIGNGSRTMGAHLETAASLSSVYNFRGIGPVRPAVLSHSVVSVHIALLPPPTHTGWSLLMCVVHGLFCTVLLLLVHQFFYFLITNTHKLASFSELNVWKQVWQCKLVNEIQIHTKKESCSI